MKYIIGMVMVLVAAGFIFKDDVSQYLVAGETATVQQENDKTKNKEVQEKAEVNIVRKWELPEVLREVSGIAYLDEERFACIQDEEGTIFIYNHASNKIEKQIPFAPPGDYEGITLNGNTAYVVRADGQLFQVSMNGGKDVKTFSTPLTVEHNVEGLFYDKDNNRLLLAVKDKDPGTSDYKGIYAFNLSGNTFEKDPVFKIQLNDAMLNGTGGKKDKAFKPSEIAIHPVTKEVYVTDGPGARLLVMDSSGTPKKVYRLGADFPQAEGITFSPRGDVYISNEGKKKGNIIQAALK